MRISSDTVQRILREVTLGIKPSKKDSEEETEFRRRTEMEVAEYKRQGIVVDILAEWPDVDK